MVTKTEHGMIRPTHIEEEMRVSYMDYAMSVIVARALPDIRDGLKPVQRRILYAMHELGMRPNTAHKKSARLVGEVLGKYHPHGDSAIYDAMVRMAQPFSLRLPLVDGQGNFGSVDDDPPAAMRYTEARLSRVAEELLVNLAEETVDYVDNFDGSLREPVLLPSRLPNLLVNGASGIAVGMATNIPPHNPSEVCAAIIRLINNPDQTNEQLMRYVKGPDFPTGAIIRGQEGIQSAYTTGRGQIIVQARAEIQERSRSDHRMQIVVTELPYQVNKASLIEKIAALVKSRRFEGISEVRDESSERGGMRIVIELRGGAQPLVILNNLYKYTPMQSTFSANMLALTAGRPRVFSLKDALQQFIDFRTEVITRRSQFQLKRAQARAHILSGLRIALGSLDEVIELIRRSDDAESARSGLMETFSLDELQAQAILDMQLRRIAALEREKIEKEYQDLQVTIRGLEELLADPGKVLDEVKRETQEVRKKHGDDRKTEIGPPVEQFVRADLEKHERIVVTLSQGGYIKRIPATTYRNQHRGGKGVSGMKTKEDDPVKHVLVQDTHDTLLFFTNRGRVLPLTAYELRPDTARGTRGVPVVNVIPLMDAERVNSIIGTESMQREDAFLVLATQSGAVKRVSLSAISNIRRAGLIIMNLRGKDELVTARLAVEEDDIIMVSRDGMSIRFRVSEIKARLRVAGGVRGMDLRARPRDRIIFMGVVSNQGKLLVISRWGYGKLTSLNRYRRQSRGGLGIKTLNITRKTGPVAAAEVVDDTQEVYVVSEHAQVLRTSLSEISSTGRITQGVTIFKAEPGDSVASIACVTDLKHLGDDDAPAQNGDARQNGRSAGK